MNCPVCKIPLVILERHEIELDYCIQCKGFWFDEGELELLPQALNIETTFPDLYKRPALKTQEKMRGCPRCNKRMDKFSLTDEAEVILDRCPRGEGIWFDANELGAVFSKHAVPKDQSEKKMVSFLGEMFHLQE